MLIVKDSESYSRAVRKSYRLLPEMFRARVSFLNGLPVITRRVVGSRGLVYTVQIQNDSVSCFDAICDCAAGLSGMVCYHVAAVYLDYHSLKIRGEVFPFQILKLAFSKSNEF